MLRNINRREFIHFAGCGGIALASGCSMVGRPDHEPRRPNIVLIMTDDQGYGDLSCYGSARINSPRVDRMAAEGVRLTSYYAGCSVCTPSRAALLTGCYAPRVSLPHVLFPSDPPHWLEDGKARGLNPDEITLADMLRAQGYATGCFGKWHLGDQLPSMPLRNGFDEFFGIPYSNDMTPGATRYDFTPLPVCEGEHVTERGPDQDRLTERITDRAIDFMRRNRRRPFFAYVPHPMPHRPVHASPRFTVGLDSNRLAAIEGEKKPPRDFLYPRCIEEIDYHTGRILDALKDYGLEDTTLVIFTSDNGPAQPGSAGPLRGGKGSAWEGGFRVPCVMRWPGHLSAGRQIDAPISAVDMLPAIAGLAGAQLPRDRVIDGCDVWPVLCGQEGAQLGREVLCYYQGNGQLAAFRRGPWKVHLSPSKANDQAGLRLLHLEEDPEERVDLSEARPDVARALVAEARAFDTELRANSRPALLTQPNAATTPSAKRPS